MPSHTVQPGDCFNSIAKDNKFYNYRTIYDHGANANDFPNPNMLTEGKTVDIPDKTLKKEPCATNKKHVFVVDRKPCHLKISAFDPEDKALTVNSCELVCGAKSLKTKATDPMELKEIDPSETAGTLKVVVKGWKPGKSKDKKPPTKRKEAQPYPPEIFPIEFEDKTVVDDLAEIKMSWDLNVGHLEPHTEDRGAIQRLINMGFNCAEVKTANDTTKNPVKMYQRKYKMAKSGKESGVLDDIRAHLKNKHDS